MDISRIVSITYIILLVLILLVYCLKGMKKGLGRMIIRLAFMAIGMILSVILTSVLIKTFQPQIATLIDNFSNDVINNLRDASPSLEVYVYQLATALVAPLVFLILFFLLSLILKIPEAIIATILCPKKDEDGKKIVRSSISKLTGVFIGVACACVSATCILMPISGYISVVSDVYVGLKEEQVLADQPQVTDVLDEVSETNENGIVKLSVKTSKPLFNSVAKLSLDGTTQSTLNDEKEVIMLLVSDGLQLSKSDFSDYTKIDMDLIIKIVDDLGGSPHLRQIMAEILKTASVKWSNGEEFLTVNLSQIVPSDLVPAVNIFLQDFTVTDKDKVITDVKNLANTAKTVIGLSTTLQNLDFNNFENIDLSKLNEAIDAIDESEKLEEVLATVMASAGEKWSNGETFLDIDVTSQIPQDYRTALNVVFEEFKNTTKATVCNDLKNFTGAVGVLKNLSTEISALDFSNYKTFNVAVLDGIVDEIEQSEIVTKVIAVIIKEAGNAWGAEPPRAYLNLNIKESLPEGYKNAFNSTIDNFKTTTSATCVSNLRKFCDTIRAYKYAIDLADTKNFEDLQKDMGSFLNAVNQDNVEALKNVITEDMLIDAGITANDATIIENLLGSTLDEISTMTPEEKEAEAEALNNLLAYAKKLMVVEGGSSTDGDSQTSSSATSSSGTSASATTSTTGSSSSSQEVSGTSTSTSTGTTPVVPSQEQLVEAVNEEEVIDSIMGSKALSKSVVEYANTQTGTLESDESQKQAVDEALNKYEDTTDATQIETISAIKQLFGLVA